MVKKQENPTKKEQKKEESTYKNRQIGHKVHKFRLKKRQKEFLEILANNLGIVTPSCVAANVARSTYYEWLANPLFAQEVDEVKASQKDFGESKLLQAMKNGSVPAIIHYNKTINRDRGYGDKVEVENNVKFENSLTPEQIEEDIKRLLGKS